MEVETINDRGQQVSRQVFSVPLSVQRYVFIQQFIMNNPNIKSVTDFGCGNGRILIWLKSIGHLEKYNGIDVDHILLELELDINFRPGFYEMMFGRQTSPLPLDIRVYHGDMSIPDDHLDADCFILVEVIEHMFPVDVERAVKTIFGYYQPKVVIVTTPNSEFNVLLRGPDEPATKFRHADHKFEWNQAQFYEWSLNITARYNYSLTMDGVGHLPGSEPYGPCTQIAIFNRQYDKGDKYALDTEANHFDLILEKLDLKDTDSMMRDKNKISLVGKYQVPGLRYDTTRDILPWT